MGITKILKYEINKKSYAICSYHICNKFLLAGIYKLMGGDYSNKLGSYAFRYEIHVCACNKCSHYQKLIHKEAIVRDLLISFKINKWFVFAWFIMPIVILYR